MRWRKFLGASNEICTTLNDPQTQGLAETMQTTRSAAAVDLWRPRMAGSIMVIGNAPTALFRCLEILEEGGQAPAAIIGCPVGFVGAAQSKQALAQQESAVPFLTVHGTRGGSAMASAVVNALAAAAQANARGTFQGDTGGKGDSKISQDNADNGPANKAGNVTKSANVSQTSNRIGSEVTQ